MDTRIAYGREDPHRAFREGGLMGDVRALRRIWLPSRWDHRVEVAHHATCSTT